MFIHPKLLAAVAAAIAGFASQANATQTQVDISSQVNSNLQTWSDGYLYPTGGSTLSNGGINFTLANYAGGGTGIVEANGNNAYPISVSVRNAATVYVLVNSAYGSSGSTVGSLVFSGDGGASYTDTLVEGVNVRDHFWNIFNNTATAAINTFWFNEAGYSVPTQYHSVRLDEYAINLPTAFLGQSLTSITLNGIDAGCCQGAPFLAAATVTSAPEPSTWAMMLAGFAGLGFAGYRAARKAVAHAA